MSDAFLSSWLSKSLQRTSQNVRLKELHRMSELKIMRQISRKTLTEPIKHYPTTHHSPLKALFQTFQLY